MFINAQLMHREWDCWTSSGFAHTPTKYYITAPIKPHPQSVYTLHCEWQPRAGLLETSLRVESDTLPVVGHRSRFQRNWNLWSCKLWPEGILSSLLPQPYSSSPPHTHHLPMSGVGVGHNTWEASHLTAFSACDSSSQLPFTAELSWYWLKHVLHLGLPFLIVHTVFSSLLVATCS